MSSIPSGIIVLLRRGTAYQHFASFLCTRGVRNISSPPPPTGHPFKQFYFLRDFAIRRSLPISLNSLLFRASYSSSVDSFNAERKREDAINTACYSIGGIIIMLGLSFAAIPLYRLFCASTGFEGTTQVAENLAKIVKMEKVSDRLIRVQFNADVNSSMQWKFKPLQNEIYVNPGETALAFYTAYNPTNRPIIGISTYNLTPFNAAYYFNKIQCFCFDEQILNPGEEVDLPVFFFIDPEFVDDPLLEDMNELMLSYTFFESKSDMNLPSPFDPANRPLNLPKAQQSQQPEMMSKQNLLKSVA